MEIILLIGGIAFLIWLFTDNSQKKLEEENRQKELARQRRKTIELQNQKLEADKKKKLEELQAEKRKLEKAAEKRKIEAQKKLEASKYESVKVIICRIEDDKPTAVLKKKDNTYAFVERKSMPFELNSTIKLDKETVAKLGWVSEEDFLIRENRKKREQKTLLDKIKYNFEESGTSYAANLESVFNSDRKNFGYSKIRQLSMNFWRTLSTDEQDRLYNELERGVAILETCDQLKYYHVSFGKKHKKKLDLAFGSLQLNPNGQSIEILDYGCGQALASVMFIDFCKANNLRFDIERIVLLEPSKAALKRGALNTKLSLKSINSNAKVYSINKKMNDISEDDIETNNENLKIHLFSNILDVDDVNIEYLARKVQKTQKGRNIYVCVSPNFYADGTHYRNKKLINFHSKFNVNPILHTFSNIGYIIAFKTGFSRELVNNHTDLEDDLPF